MIGSYLTSNCILFQKMVIITDIIWSVCIHSCVPLYFPENAAKVRIALVKGHGVVMVQSLQGRAQEASSDMQKWLEAHYLAEMKRYGGIHSPFMCVYYDMGRVCLYRDINGNKITILYCSTALWLFLIM